MADRDTERETVVVDSGRGGGSGAAIAAILVIAVIGILAFLFFAGYLTKATDGTDINVNVGTPKIELPDIRIDNPPAAPAPAPAPAQPAANQSGK